jgi:hypothetical protein
VGDIAIGVVLAVGPVAVGGISLGAASLGLLSVGGLALGMLVVGGAAAGVWVVAGAAFAWHAAFGGFAVAGQYAEGGVAIAPHTHGALAAQYFEASRVFRLLRAAVPAVWLLVILPILLSSGLRRKSRT